MNGATVPLIFDIRRFALDDGPGIRTTVFFKGCPLTCAWCHNPESLKAEAEIAFYPRLCIRCGDCAAACPAGAIKAEPVRIDRDRCDACGRCAEVCPATALKMVGRYYSPDKLLELLLRDRTLFESSGGGVTFSGGEPTLHMDYLGEILGMLKSQDIHTAVQTCGMFAMDRFREKVLPHLDIIFYDLKFVDAKDHLAFTGNDNGIILENFAALIGETREKIRPRTPLIPGATATRDNLSGIARFLKNLGCNGCEALPFNPAGLAKRAPLPEGFPPAVSTSMMPPEEEKLWKRLLAEELGSPSTTSPEFIA
ncbi:MAG TPA: glycyl-radical enzyme activating protein [Geobacteraceae bacterium]|nr:glycyl-radical enzyme activating protein [Geobacteraceae bacterium]